VAEIVYNTALSGKIPDRGFDEKVTITKMGRLGKRKGTYDLLEAFSRIASKYHHVHLIMAGDGDVEKIRKRVKKLGLEDRVEVPGWVSGHRVAEVYSTTDIYVLPSYNEGLPNSILEAMAWRLPVVATPVGGIPEAVIDGKTGFLVEAGDIDALFAALDRLLTDHYLRLKMGKAGFDRFKEKFDIEQIVQRVLKLQRRIVSDGKF